MSPNCERLALGRRDEGDLRGQGADRQQDLGRGPPAGRVGDLQRRPVVAVLGERVVAFGRRESTDAVGVEVPRVPQAVAVRVGRAGAGEASPSAAPRRTVGRGRDLRDRACGCRGRSRSGPVARPGSRRSSRRRTPGRRARRPGRTPGPSGCRRRSTAAPRRIAVTSFVARPRRELLDVVAGPLVEQRLAVVVLRPLGRRLVLGVEVVRRPAHRADAARAQLAGTRPRRRTSR